MGLICAIGQRLATASSAELFQLGSRGGQGGVTAGRLAKRNVRQAVRQGWIARNVATLRPEPKESNMKAEMFVKMNMKTLCF